ncbi:MAG: lipoprotein insertase outer membrane protein LolB [Burkholderiales bacterium]
MNGIARIATAGLLLLVAGCATMGGGVPEATPFELVGRVLVRTGDHAFSSNLRWRHEAQAEQIWLLSPLGQTLAYITEDGTGATLTAANGEVYHASSVAGLTQQALGWELPLAQLRYWVMGKPVPHEPAHTLQRDAENRLTYLTQDGYRVAWLYSQASKKDKLPRRLDLTGTGSEIRLVIDNWRSRSAASPAPAVPATHHD